MPPKRQIVQGASGDELLAQRIRPRVMLLVMTHQGYALATLFLVPLLFSIVDSEYSLALRLAPGVAFFGILGLVGSRIDVPDDLRTHEVLAIVALTSLSQLCRWLGRSCFWTDFSRRVFRGDVRSHDDRFFARRQHRRIVRLG